MLVTLPNDPPGSTLYVGLDGEDRANGAMLDGSIVNGELMLTSEYLHGIGDQLFEDGYNSIELELRSVDDNTLDTVVLDFVLASDSFDDL